MVGQKVLFKLIDWQLAAANSKVFHADNMVRAAVTSRSNCAGLNLG